MKWDIRFCALELDPALFEFRLNYYRNQEEWQARMPPKGSIGVGLAHVELLRSMAEPVDYRMTLRTRERVFSFRASLKDLKLWIATIRTATLCSAATWSSQVRSPKLTVGFSQSSYILMTYRVVGAARRRWPVLRGLSSDRSLSSD